MPWGGALQLFEHNGPEGDHDLLYVPNHGADIKYLSYPDVSPSTVTHFAQSRHFDRRELGSSRLPPLQSIVRGDDKAFLVVALDHSECVGLGGIAVDKKYEGRFGLYVAPAYRGLATGNAKRVDKQPFFFDALKMVRQYFRALEATEQLTELDAVEAELGIRISSNYLHKVTYDVPDTPEARATADRFGFRPNEGEYTLDRDHHLRRLIRNFTPPYYRMGQK